jgi:hypothetical protein
MVPLFLGQSDGAGILEDFSIDPESAFRRKHFGDER